VTFGDAFHPTTPCLCPPRLRITPYSTTCNPCLSLTLTYTRAGLYSILPILVLFFAERFLFRDRLFRNDRRDKHCLTRRTVHFLDCSTDLYLTSYVSLRLPTLWTLRSSIDRQSSHNTQTYTLLLPPTPILPTSSSIVLHSITPHPSRFLIVEPTLLPCLLGPPLFLVHFWSFRR
jgi:hypothetical protein